MQADLLLPPEIVTSYSQREIERFAKLDLAIENRQVLK
jgi:hypothetical protein